jgi:hypothetical protein
MQLSTTKKVAGGVLAAALVLGGGAVALAQATPDRPVVVQQESTTTTTEPAAAQQAPAEDSEQGKGRGPGFWKRHPGLRLIAKAPTGTLKMKQEDGTYAEVSYGRGEVKEVSDTSITLTLPDELGEFTASIDDSTVFRGVASASEVQVGKQALVVKKGDVAQSVNQGDGDGKPLRDKANKQRGNGRGPAGTPGATAPGNGG